MKRCISSDLVVNEKMSRLFFIGAIGDIQRFQARDTRPIVRYLTRKEENRFGEGLQAVVGI